MKLSFFSGNLAIIYDYIIIRDILFNDPYSIVFSLDEDNEHPELDPERNPTRIAMGTMLLPPVEAMWSLTSGEWDKFQMEYYTHLMSPEVTEFIFMIIGLMYKGRKIILYYPDDSSEVINYLVQFFMSNLGIHIFEPIKQNDLFGYDENKIPIYLCGIYYSGMISPEEFLLKYPPNAPIPNDIYPKLVFDMRLVGDNLADKVKLIDEIRKKSQEGRGYIQSPFINLD